MIIPGLVSVTFRQKTPLEICRLCKQAHLRVIEWGGDVHVPPHAPNVAEIRRMSQDYGLNICSYGSYYRAGESLDKLRFCLDTAYELGTNIVRIWGGIKGSQEAEAEREQLVDCLINCAEEARARSLCLSLEYHGGTLTDSRDSVQRLMRETATVADCLKFHWQPRFDWSSAECLSSLEDVRSRLAHLHVFSWAIDNRRITRLPLKAGENLWETIFSSFSEPQCALMEFVQNDSEEAFLRDAKVLHQWID